jgi:purine-binding chemotaxis protein CheW
MADKGPKSKKSLLNDPFEGMGELPIQDTPAPDATESDLLSQMLGLIDAEEEETGTSSVNEVPEPIPPAPFPEMKGEQIAEGMPISATKAAEIDVPSAPLPFQGGTGGEVLDLGEGKEMPALEEVLAEIDAETTVAASPVSPIPIKPSGASSQGRYVLFSLATTEYAVPIENVSEIGRPLKVTWVPNVPDWILGVANLRGDVLSIVDLAAFLNIQAPTQPTTGRMLVAHSPLADMSTGLIVDRVNGIRNLPGDQILPPTAPIADRVAPYLRGVCEYEGHLLVVLDLDQLLLSPEMQQKTSSQ